MWTDYLTEDQYQSLRSRLGDKLLEKRLEREATHNIMSLGGHGPQINWESMNWVHEVFRFLLKITGQYEKGIQNALRYKIVTRQVSLKKTPNAFKGYRILQLSDLHIDAIEDRGAKLKEILKHLEYDLCVMTGDFRFGTVGPFSIMVKRMEDLMGHIQCPDGVYGILGNHDFIEMVPYLEKTGIRFLLNEHAVIEREGQRFFLCGVEDEHFYEVSDIEKVHCETDKESLRILLAHSQELIPRAAQLHFDYYLCGHTHGGQVCLPGGFPVITNTGLHKRFVKGAWEHEGLKGYTSCGTGSSGLFVRYHCAPEVALHILA